MLSLGALSFAMPWALLALAALPLVWWLLRVTPPAPWRVRFPPVRLLLSLTARQESAASSPWWLLALRLALVAAVVLAVAHPLLGAGAGPVVAGPLILIVDDGWAAARRWPLRRTKLAGLIDRAARDGRAVAVIATAPPAAGAAPLPLRLMAAAEARRLVETLRPKPWPTRRAAALRRLNAGLALERPAHVVWLSDGLAEGDVAALADPLRRLGLLTVVQGDPAAAAKVLRPPRAEGVALSLQVVRAWPAAGETVWVRALAEDGTPLARQGLVFAAGKATAEVRFELPAELRNRVARLEIEGENTAAGVVLVDERWRRRPVGLVSASGVAADQPLLSDLYYLERALEPYTEVRRGSVGELLRRGLAVLVLADTGRLDGAERQLLEGWIADGGVAVRFAGPRLAQDAEVLLPVPLRRGDRVLGGAMSWSKPASLAPFDANSPFHGLDVPAGVTVQRQVLARPSPDLAERTWAKLSDGTPLVSAQERGKGWLVLVHTTANAEWSNLALSGLFVDMLRRFVALSQGVADQSAAASLPPLEVLDGFGRLGAPPAGVLAIAGDALGRTRVGPKHPPGYYGEAAARRALNLTAELPDPAPIGALPSGVIEETYATARQVDLKPWLLLAALVLAVADLAASLALRRLLRLPGAAALVFALIAAGAPARAADDDAFALAASLQTRLAYVITDDAAVDETTRAGLMGLSVIVNRRTAAELADPVGIVPETDELAFFPLLYWAVTEGQPTPSAEAAARLNAYMRGGGTLLFDSRGQDGGDTYEVLRRLTEVLDIPPLVPVPPDHVLTRAYYLMRQFPGRWTGGALWVERAGERINDGVSSVIVGGNNWAAAWAMDADERHLFAVVPGGERQREMAYRFGINLVMYTLTGNYKSDQVHMPAILQRLGQ